MNKEPYKAYKDSNLHSLLYSLNRGSIHPQYIETDSAILVQVSSAYDLDVKVDCYIDEDGITFNDWRQHMNKLTFSTQTLMQLAAMSTCFAAGYAKARQEQEEQQKEEQP